MKRILLSLVVGFLFPFLYAIVIGPLTLDIENRMLKRLLEVPVRWPIMVLEQAVGFEGLGRFPFRDEDQWALLAYLIICNTALYSALTYVLLFFIKKPKRSTPELPPQPPPFPSH